MPQVTSVPEQWGPRPQWFNQKLNWGFSGPELTRLFSGFPDSATPQEVSKIETSLRAWGRKHNMPGWQEIGVRIPAEEGNG